MGVGLGSSIFFRELRPPLFFFVNPKTTPSFMVECRGKVLFNDIVIAISIRFRLDSTLLVPSRFSSLLLNRLCPVSYHPASKGPPYIVYIYIYIYMATHSQENFLLPHSRLSIMAVGWSRTLFANLALSQHPTSFRAECACAKNQATKTIFTTFHRCMCAFVCVCVCVSVCARVSV